MNATLNPNVLRWARKRAGFDEVGLAKKLHIREAGLVEEWESTGEIEFSKLEKLAYATNTPIGFMFLANPPSEQLPIKDFRRLGSGPVPPITPNLLDVIYAAQRRQEWYRSFLKENGAEPLLFVGSVSIGMDIYEASELIISTLRIGPRLSIQAANWIENLSFHIDAIEAMGVLVMRSGVVGNSTNRKLSVADFRGFALADAYAPVIFINSTDSVSAQIFTLIHELVHVFINESAVSNLQNTYAGTPEIEKYCNAVAAEILVPRIQVVERWSRSNDPIMQIRKLAANYKVSTLVAARRVLDAGFITADQFEDFVEAESARIRRKKSNGGDAYNNINARASGKFVEALISHTLEGKTLYGEAMRLLGLKSSKVLDGLAKRLGFAGR